MIVRHYADKMAYSRRIEKEGREENANGGGMAFQSGPPPGPWVGRLDEAIAVGASGTVVFQDWGGSSFADTTVSVEAINIGPSNAGDDSRVLVEEISGYYFFRYAAAGGGGTADDLTIDGVAYVDSNYPAVNYNNYFNVGNFYYSDSQIWTLFHLYAPLAAGNRIHALSLASGAIRFQFNISTPGTDQQVGMGLFAVYDDFDVSLVTYADVAALVMDKIGQIIIDEPQNIAWGNIDLQVIAGRLLVPVGKTLKGLCLKPIGAASAGQLWETAGSPLASSPTNFFAS